MKRKFSTAALAAVVAIAGLTGFALDAVVAPQPLQAEPCGPYSGQLCGRLCNRECGDGSCCSWSNYYYPKIIDQT